MTTEPLDLEPIKSRIAAATKGPWAWRGNTDHHEIRLVGQGEHWLVDVLSTVKVERTKNDPEIERNLDLIANGDDPEVREMLEDAWVEDPWTQCAREDERLALLTKEMFREPAEEFAVYEVARVQGLPDDTPADHPKVYRRDVVDLNHPDARFMAHSRQDLEDAVTEIERLRAILADHGIDQAAAPQVQAA